MTAGDLRTILTLDASASQARIALLQDDRVLADITDAQSRGLAARLAPAVAAVLAGAGRVNPEAIAVIVGPGSFTGLRASIALAHGFAASAGAAVIGVTLAEAAAAAFPKLATRALWTAIARPPDRVFLAVGEVPFAVFPLDGIPDPSGPVAIVGDATIPVAARLAARGADVMLTDLRHPRPRDIATAARQRASGALPPLTALPIYGEAPLAKPAGAHGPTLLRASAAHATALAALLAACAPSVEAWSVGEVATLLASPGVAAFLDQSGGCVMVRTVATEAEILALAVQPNLRRTGRGRALMAAAERHAKDTGATELFLEVALGNADARAFYAATGFGEVGRRRAYYRNGGDAAVLRRALIPAAAPTG